MNWMLSSRQIRLSSHLTVTSVQQTLWGKTIFSSAYFVTVVPIEFAFTVIPLCVGRWSCSRQAGDFGNRLMPQVWWHAESWHPRVVTLPVTVDWRKSVQLQSVPLISYWSACNLCSFSGLQAILKFFWNVYHCKVIHCITLRCGSTLVHCNHFQLWKLTTDLHQGPLHSIQPIQHH